MLFGRRSLRPDTAPHSQRGGRCSSFLEMFDWVQTLFFDEHIGAYYAYGQVTATDYTLRGKSLADTDSQEEVLRLIATDMQSTLGSGGSPVINGAGDIVGAMYRMRPRDFDARTLVTGVSMILSTENLLRVRADLGINWAVDDQTTEEQSSS